MGVIMTVPESARGTGRWLRVVTFAIGVGVVAHAQTQQPPEQPAASEPAASEPVDAESQPVFRAGITLVSTDVIVRDEDGVFISNLAAEEFIVREDGVVQEVVSLVLVHGGRVFNQLAPPPAVREGIILPPTRRSNDTAGRIIILFVDDLHLESSMTPKARAVFRTITDTLIHQGDLFGIVSSGPSSLSIDLTYDRSILRDAEEKIMGDGYNNRQLIQEISQGVDGPSELRFRGHQAMKTVFQTVRNLEQVQDRRKVLVYMSSGYDYNPFHLERMSGFGLAAVGRTDEGYNRGGLGQVAGVQQGPRINPFEQFDQGSEFANLDLVAELAELARAANRANTSFYTVDPRGLVAGPGIDFDVSSTSFNQYLFRTQQSLRMLADLTGGTAVVNRNDFEKAFREIDAETSDYYVLGFYTNNPDPTQRTRQLDITVDREAPLQVKSRTSYTFARQDGNAPQ